MSEREKRDQPRNLRGEEIVIPYDGTPVQVLVGKTVLEIGKPEDLGIKKDPQPLKFNIISAVRLSETNGAQGRLRLKDGGAAILGTDSQQGFNFGPDVSRLHVAIKSLGNKIVIRDLNSDLGTVVYAEENSPSKST